MDKAVVARLLEKINSGVNFSRLTQSDWIIAYQKTLKIDMEKLAGLPKDHVWNAWVNSGAPREGFSMLDRYIGWFSDKPFPPVLAYSLKHKEVVLVTGVASLKAINIYTERGTHLTASAATIVPIFANKITNKCFASPQTYRQLSKAVFDAAKSEPVEITDFEMATTKTKYEEDKAHTEKAAKQYYNNSDKLAASVAALGASFEAVNEKITYKGKQESNMNAKVNNLVATEKAAAEQTMYLTAGRTTNKLVKEAVRPILELVFKPSFIQRIALKLFKSKNPIDQFMDSPASDVVCARLFRVLLELKGVEDQRVLRAANNAIVYSNLKVADELPIEDLIDGAISKVTEGIEKLDVVNKVKGSL